MKIEVESFNFQIFSFFNLQNIAPPFVNFIKRFQAFQSFWLTLPHGKDLNQKH